MISSNNRTDLVRFRTLALLTVLIIYLLILAGGIVRGTGSGMGCPDWPKCFGQWVPPTNINQLPPNYQEIYGAKLKGEVIFNPVKTWIEYINRLLGVLSGFFVFATLVSSIALFKRDSSLFWGSLAAFLLIGANGWLGSKVVSTELAQYLITAHLLLAIFVVFALLYVWVKANKESWSLSESVSSRHTRKIRNVAMAVIALTIIQLILGTEVRDQLDAVVKRLGYDNRQGWIDQLNWPFYVHRSFSLLVLGAHLYLIHIIQTAVKNGIVKTFGVILVVLVIFEIVTGAVMGYFAVPAFAQPIHILLAVMLVGIQFMIVLLTSQRATERVDKMVSLQSS
ncbi:cytochrome c oxidase assembly protein subunit 15 [Spirosoma oryzae]|uniref:Cytochrome c oxidase assembly protein subunit 15 n=1 Tax=Spirosoma oryzae TaxID=1469603 RepID=A0A2T0TI92_9BACT|nr:COX15/CtaA family protein [Spirosoma oryzae]PRY45422.1 cytochrome c oxidase assembly protein subunit 15 [Spirosoma oryzae]